MPFNPDGTFTLPTGATNAFAGQTIASATWDAIFTDIQTALGHNLGIRSFVARTVNFNPSVATDNPITVSLTTSRYLLEKIVLTNATGTLTTAVVGLYTAASGGGVTLVLSTQPNVTTGTNDTAGNLTTLTICTTLSVTNMALNDTTLQFRVITAEGGAATADVILYVRPL